MRLSIGRCHGFLGRPNDPYCYHPGPGILPVWASDLLAWVTVLLIFAIVIFAYKKMSKLSLLTHGNRRDTVVIWNLQKKR
jgi:hypothetical protein